MRTKTLVLTAVLSVAGAAASFAQAVYSVNAVGYVNKVIPPGYSMIANPLNNTAANGNTVAVLFPSVPNGTSIFQFDNDLGVYVRHSYLFGWNTPPTNDVAEAFFVNKVSATTWTRDFSVNTTP